MNPFYAQQLMQDDAPPQQIQQPDYGIGMPQQGNPLSSAMMSQDPSLQQMPPEMQQQMPQVPMNMPMQMLPQQQSFQQPVNPLASGVASAIDSARLSLQMRADQKQQALTSSLIGMAQASANQNNQQWGMSPGASLSRSIAGVIPAGLSAYQNAEQQAVAENAAMAQQAQMQQMAQQKAMEQSIEKAYMRQHREEELGERKRHNMAMEEERRFNREMMGLQQEFNRRQVEKEQEKELKQIEKTAKGLHYAELGATPLSLLEKGARAEYQKKAHLEYDQIPLYQKNLKTLPKMEKIFQKWADKGEEIGTSYLQIMGELEEGSKSWKSAVYNFFSRSTAKFSTEKVADLQKLAKYTSDLNLSEIRKQQGGKVVTDMLKKIITRASPSPSLMGEAFRSIASDWRENAIEAIQRARARKDAMSSGFAYDIPVSREEEESHGERGQSGIMDQSSDIDNGSLDRNAAPSTSDAHVLYVKTPDGRILKAKQSDRAYLESKGGIVIEQ